MKISKTFAAVLFAVGVAVPSYSLAAGYEATDSEISFVCKGDKECINIVNDELADITISGNLRYQTQDQFKEQVKDYCDEDNSIQCRNYLSIMLKTFDQAYKDGDK